MEPPTRKVSIRAGVACRPAGALLDQQQGSPQPGGVPNFHYWLTGGDANGATTTEVEADDAVYLTRDIIDAFIDGYDNDRPEEDPWFAHIAFTAPHEPFHCPPQGSGRPYPADIFDCKADHSSDPELNYHNMVTALDIEIDRILEAIGGDSSGTPPTNPENTLIIVASDNGSPSAVAQDPVVGSMARCRVYQGGVRVPQSGEGPTLAKEAIRNLQHKEIYDEALVQQELYDLHADADSGDVPIDSGRSERGLRAVAIGRKSWTFAGSNAGGIRAARLYSLIASCRRNGVDSFLLPAGSAPAPPDPSHRSDRRADPSGLEGRDRGPAASSAARRRHRLTSTAGRAGLPGSAQL